MKTGRNLQEVLVELNRQNQAKQDFISRRRGCTSGKMDTPLRLTT